jgi:hypothetical protein
MSIELTDDMLAEIRERARERLEASLVEYRRLFQAVQAKLPSVTDEAVAALKERFAQGTHHDDGQPATHAALFCALYQLAVDRGRECLTLLKTGHADGEILRNLMWVTSSAFESLAGLAVVLNGGPLAQSFVDDTIQRLREHDYKLDDIQQSFDKLLAETGRAPSQRAVAEYSGYNRETVAKRWPHLKKNRPN